MSSWTRIYWWSHFKKQNQIMNSTLKKKKEKYLRTTWSDLKGSTKSCWKYCKCWKKILKINHRWLLFSKKCKNTATLPKESPPQLGLCDHIHNHITLYSFLNILSTVISLSFDVINYFSTISTSHHKSCFFPTAKKLHPNQNLFYLYSPQFFLLFFR